MLHLSLLSSGYCGELSPLGLLIPADVSPGNTSPTAEPSVWSVPHTPAWLSPPDMSSLQLKTLSCASQRGSPGTTVDKEKVLNFIEAGDILGEDPSPLPQSLEQCHSPEACHSPIELMMTVGEATEVPGLLPAQTLAGKGGSIPFCRL